ncbi:MAG: hypothetical protein K0B02_05100 [DPANN group archaeon]|nr:hypothetical protein [DPANN group archaeon]
MPTDEMMTQYLLTSWDYPEETGIKTISLKNIEVLYSYSYTLEELLTELDKNHENKITRINMELSSYFPDAIECVIKYIDKNAETAIKTLEGTNEAYMVK